MKFLKMPMLLIFSKPMALCYTLLTLFYVNASDMSMISKKKL